MAVFNVVDTPGFKLDLEVKHTGQAYHLAIYEQTPEFGLKHHDYFLTDEQWNLIKLYFASI